MKVDKTKLIISNFKLSFKMFIELNVYIIYVNNKML